MAASLDQKHWAVVVPNDAHNCHDVLGTSSDMVEHSPGPFGIRVQPCDEHISLQGPPLPLIYVSVAAAQDRSQDRNPLNGSGVHAGWYVLAKPGRFAVQVSQLKNERYGLPWEDVIEVNLEMDGHSIHRRKPFVQKNNQYGAPPTGSFLFEGFIEGEVRLQSKSLPGLYIIRPFSFEKVSPEEDDNIHSNNVGTIALKAKACQIELRNVRGDRRFFNPLPNEKVSEKAVAKHGKTMKVSSTLSPILKMRQGNGVISRVINSRLLPEVEITLHVRERSWLRSRRLIDDNDQPVTYASFRTLLQEDQSLHLQTQTQRNNVMRNAKTRTSAKEEAIVLDAEGDSTPTQVRFAF